MLPLSVLAEVSDDPRVMRFHKTSRPLVSRVDASFFQTTGWQESGESTRPFFMAEFDPKKDWLARVRGELRMLFEDDGTKRKTTLKLLMQHNLKIITGERPPPPLSPHTRPVPAHRTRTH